MDQPEYESPITGFEVWREADGTWRGRHKDSGRTIHAEHWELLVWRAREAIVFVTITNVGKLIDQVTPDEPEA